ncbi:MAG: hypothetical protein IKN15_05365 [Bacteroidaceae bacterium]|nr:hypothetical protein [Bacteroidaceae bacterium]
MAFLDLTIKLTDGKRVRMSDRTNRSSRDCKPKKYIQYIHDECPDDTIPMTSVANILAKLAGKRPWKRSDIECGKVPSYFSHFIEMANSTYVDIVTPSDNKEIIRSKKPSHSPTKDTWELILDGNRFSMWRNRPTYETVRATLDDVDWQNLETMLIKVFGTDYRSKADSGAYTVPSMITSLRDAYVNGKDEVIQFCETYKDTKTKIRDLLIVPVTTGTPVTDGDGYRVFRIDNPIGKSSIERVIHTKTNTYGIIMMQVVSGVLHVKVTENELNMFRNGPGFATFLDGGVAEIETLDLDYWQHETDNLPKPYTATLTAQD